MYDALSLLSELTSDEITRLFEHGNEQQVIAGTRLIAQGETPEAIFLVLEGLVAIEVDTISTHVLAHRGPGELLGELSFLDGQPASATVRAAENSLLLALPRALLEAMLEKDPAFAARFYRSCALISCKRLRQGAVEAGLRAREQVEQQEGALAAVYARIAQPITHLKELLHRADQEGVRNHDQVPENLAGEIVETFGTVMLHLNEEVGDRSGLGKAEREDIGAHLQREILPYVLLTRIGERCYAKPRGYAGDFMTIEWFYQNSPDGVGRLGPVLDRCFLNAPAARAVRNRRGLLGEHIRAALDQAKGQTARITSMACGPAAEVFDVFESLEDRSKLRATLIDIDLQALAFVSDRCERLKLRRQVDLFNGNLVYLATGRQKLDLRDQDLVYSIGLIDYFNDKFVVALLDYVYTLLRPGGKVVLGNFRVDNPDKALMDYILDWKLIHRSEEDMNRLYQASRFARPCTAIRTEPAGVNLFAECIKGD